MLIKKKCIRINIKKNLSFILKSIIIFEEIRKIE